MHEGLLVFKVLPRKNGKPICPKCGKKGPVYDTQPSRTWRHLAGFGVHVLIEYAPRRVKCRHCHCATVEQMPWNQGKCHLTKPLQYQTAKWARELSWGQVAELFEVDWTQVENAVESAVEYGLEHRDTDNVKLIGIDEISRRKGHKYLTQVYEIDKERRRLLWSGEDNSKATLREFFDSWGDKRNSCITGVCCDLWGPYIEVIQEKIPQAVLVLDKFHAVGLLNRAVDDVRREEAAELREKGETLLKKTRFIWLKNPENLTIKQQIKLHQLEAKSLKTHRAYVIKKSFQTIWDYADPETAEYALDAWFLWATHSQLNPIQKAAWTIYVNKKHLLNYYKVKINNSVVEGLNNKAKVIMRRAYGFHSVKICKLALMHCMGKLDLPKP